MSLTSTIQRLFGFERKSGTASPDAWMFDHFGGHPTSSGVSVTPRSAMECAPVHCAVQAISEATGQLPVHTYKRGQDGAKDRDTDHPTYALLHDAPNEWTPAPKFREEITRDALLHKHGGFAFINRVDGNKPFELIRIDPDQSSIDVNYEAGEPVYKIDGKIIDRSNILHIPSPSLNGRGLIDEGREAIGLAITLERHAAQLFGRGARPSGVLALKGGGITADALVKAKAAWEAAHGGTKSGGTAVIPSDASWQSLTLSSVDAQFLELRRFAVNEIARLFRVPSHMLFELERAAFKNTENMGQEFLTYTLMSWIKRWEGEINLKLFTPEERKTHYAEFLTDDFARADMLARMEALSVAIAARIINPNEARSMMNRPSYPGGDKFENPNTTSPHIARPTDRIAA